MPKAWNQFLRRSEEISHQVSDHYIDISLEQTDGDYSQLICAEVSEIAAVPDGMIAQKIPEKHYMYYRHEGPVGKIAASFGKMYDWAKQNGYTAESIKLDIGYTSEQSETGHDLYITVLD